MMGMKGTGIMALDLEQKLRTGTDQDMTAPDLKVLFDDLDNAVRELTESYR